jgi:hypothetical protein
MARARMAVKTADLMMGGGDGRQVMLRRTELNRPEA